MSPPTFSFCIQSKESCQGNIYSIELRAVHRMAGYRISSQRSHLVNISAVIVIAYFRLQWIFDNFQRILKFHCTCLRDHLVQPFLVACEYLNNSIKVMKNKVGGSILGSAQRFDERLNTQQKRREVIVQTWKAYKDHFPKHVLQMSPQKISLENFKFKRLQQDLGSL